MDDTKTKCPVCEDGSCLICRLGDPVSIGPSTSFPRKASHASVGKFEQGCRRRKPRSHAK